MMQKINIGKNSNKIFALVLIAVIGFIAIQTYTTNNTQTATYIIQQNGVNYEAISGSDTIWSSTNASYVINQAAQTPGSIFIKGTLNCDSPVTLTKSETTLYSDGSGKLVFNNCNGVLIQANKVSVHDIEIYQNGELRTKTGILASRDSAIGYLTFSNVKIWGWATALQLNQVWTSTFTGLDTTFSNTALTIHGQSVNNVFSNCQFINFGKTTPTVLIEKDANGLQPEANNFANCIVFGGTFGFEILFAAYTQIGTGCTIDGWLTNGVYIDNGANTQITSGAWIGSTLSSFGCVVLRSSMHTGVVGCDLYNPSGTGVVLEGGSTYNRVNSNNIECGTGIQEISSADDYNNYVGNTFIGPVYGNNVIILGPHSTRTGNNPSMAIIG